MQTPNLIAKISRAVAVLSLMSALTVPAAEAVVGAKATGFEAATTDGKRIKFPDAYKGKIVLLDFWATWCGPCRMELPGLVAAYEKYHGQGFEVLGVSLDRANEGAKLAQFTKENHMPWQQVYDGKYWQAEVAQKYSIHSIPKPILVDGDTGLILAEGHDLRGKQLAPSIAKFLAAKKKP
jgi:thiol-disulfide isomerase/thioredoxin